MKTPLERIRLGALLFGVILIVAIIGYRVAGFRWIDSIYMVVITVSSVGFTDSGFPEDPLIKLFTIAVIIFGMSAAAYTIGGLIQMMAEGEISRALGRHRLTRGIGQLKGHVIICGFGRIGQILAGDLKRQHQPFTVIDNDPERIAEASDLECLVISGDATEEHVLLAAGVTRAKTLVTGLPNDAANVFITLTSRNLNPDVQIIARAEFPTTEKKLIQAGANRVVMPASIGARQMGRMITRPSTADLMDLVADRTILDVELDELGIPAGCQLVGQSVAETEANRTHRLLVVAVKQSQGNMVFNPGGDYKFQDGDTIIVMGRMEDIDRFRKEFEL